MSIKNETLAYKQRKITIRTEDGRALRGDHFTPQSNLVRAGVLICSSTATPRYIYTKFAQHLASMGFAVITFDYQGVAESRTIPLREDRASKQTWGRLDMPAALDRLHHEHDDVPLFLIGHSVGAQLMGLMHNRDLLHGIASFGSSYGYWGYMTAPYKHFVWTMWHIIMPAVLPILGYTPTRSFGFGEDMPMGVGADWSRWGRKSYYFEREFADEPGFQALNIPWLSLVATDDQVATPQSARALQNFYPNAKKEMRLLEPREYGYSHIGHMGFFSGERRKLWPEMTDWLEEQLGLS